MLSMLLLQSLLTSTYTSPLLLRSDCVVGSVRLRWKATALQGCTVKLLPCYVNSHPLSSSLRQCFPSFAISTAFKTLLAAKTHLHLQLKQHLLFVQDLLHNRKMGKRKLIFLVRCHFFVGQLKSTLAQGAKSKHLKGRLRERVRRTLSMCPSLCL